MAQTRKYTSLPYTEYTVADGHYDTSRKDIVKIILHSSASTKQGLIDTFGGGSRMVSAHYGIDNDGNLMAFLEEYYTAYHAGNYDVNQTSIGIEHVDDGAAVKLHTDKQYNMSYKLVADICKFYNIPCDSTHIVPHSSIVSTACPNGLDVNRIINGARSILGNTPIIDDCPAKLAEKTALETELRGVITGKDTTIANLNSTIDSKNRQIADLEASNKQLADQLKECQFQLTSKTEQAGKLPACEQLTLEQEKRINELKNTIQSRDMSIAQYKSRWELMKWSLKKLIVEKIVPMI